MWNYHQETFLNKSKVLYLSPVYAKHEAWSKGRIAEDQSKMPALAIFLSSNSSIDTELEMGTNIFPVFHFSLNTHWNSDQNNLY